MKVLAAWRHLAALFCIAMCIAIALQSCGFSVELSTEGPKQDKKANASKANPAQTKSPLPSGTKNAPRKYYRP